jgi:hypothetical protein
MAEELYLKDLIKWLNVLLEEEGNFPVGRIGHYGEFHHMGPDHLNFYAAEVDENGERIDIIHIEPPDIGPEPD